MRIIPVRLIVLFVLFFALYIGCQEVPGLIFHVAKNSPQRGLFDLESAAFLAVVMIVAYRLAIRLTEDRRATELGAKDAFLGLAGGVLLGALLFSCVYASL